VLTTKTCRRLVGGFHRSTTIGDFSIPVGINVDYRCKFTICTQRPNTFWATKFHTFIKQLCKTKRSLNERLTSSTVSRLTPQSRDPLLLLLLLGHSMPNQQRIVRTSLRFWRNLVCLECLWCLSLMQIFSSIHHIVSDLWPQIFWIFHKKLVWCELQNQL